MNCPVVAADAIAIGSVLADRIGNSWLRILASCLPITPRGKELGKTRLLVG